MAQPTILVTGATGTIGSSLVDELVQRGITVRAAARGASGHGVLRRPSVEAVDLTLGDDASVDAAMKGVSALFLLTPLAPDQVALGQHLVDRARAAGVRRVVKLSAFGAEIEPGIQLGRWHRAVEKHIEASGLSWTFLRPNNFMENFMNYYAPDRDGVIYLPWGTAACSFIDGRDVARVAAQALTTDGHEGKAYTLTGPEAFSIADAAATIGAVTGRSIRYIDVPEQAARDAMLGAGMPAFAVDGMMELHAIDKAGYAAVVTPDFTTITGAAPRTFRAFAEEHRARWA